jgi:hypothetical protein
MKATSATQQHQTLRARWPQWRNIAAATGPTDRTQAEDAVRRLYAFYNRPDVQVCWLDSVHRIPEQYVGTPLLTHLRQSLIYAVWHQLQEPAWVCAQIGYNQHDGLFRLPSNWRVVMTRAAVAPRRVGRRTPWLRAGTNAISQFDVDALAIVDLATACGLNVEKSIQRLAEIVGDLVHGCFAALLFEEHCILISKPKRLVLSETLILGTQNGPAFESHELYRLYIMNGRVLATNREPYVNYDLLVHWSSPRMRVALIEYMGWEAFLAMMLQHRQANLLGRDRYGSLYVIRCGTQEFTVVQVTNRTAEPDGHYRQYVIPVDRFCRPLPDPRDPRQQFGNPQPLTPLNAVASTFGMTGLQYAAILGKES